MECTSESHQMNCGRSNSCCDTHEVEKDMIDQPEETRHKRGKIHELNEEASCWFESRPYGQCCKSVSDCGHHGGAGPDGRIISNLGRYFGTQPGPTRRHPAPLRRRRPFLLSVHKTHYIVVETCLLSRGLAFDTTSIGITVIVGNHVASTDPYP